MSFILDALKKSETERQQKGSAEFAGVPTSNSRQTAPRWLWVIGGLLLINLLVLIGLMLRPEPSSPVPVEVAVPVAEQKPETGKDDFAEQVAVAKQNVPQREAPGTNTTETPSRSMPIQSALPIRTPTNTAALPTIHEVVANGTLMLPDLHVDIHVYSEVPKDRFVFINMNKHNEGSRLAEGPLVEEITPDGVVLKHEGTSFLLPRD